MAHETSKSIPRRSSDRRFATMYFRGNGIDVGCGPDSLTQHLELFPLITAVKEWDTKDGDGQNLDGLEDESFDFVHASHSLEHMESPEIALTNWIRVCKEGGHLILLLPDEDMFEQGVWPSRYSNGDHRFSWTIGKRDSWSPASINLIEFLHKFIDVVEILKLEKLDGTYSYSAKAMDQTRTVIGECAIEIILRKRTTKERNEKGRLPEQIMFTYSA